MNFQTKEKSSVEKYKQNEKLENYNTNLPEKDGTKNERREQHNLYQFSIYEFVVSRTILIKNIRHTVKCNPLLFAPDGHNYNLIEYDFI